MAVWAGSSVPPALLSPLCSVSLCQPVKPEGTLWVNQRLSSANTSSGRCPAKGAKASRERELIVEFKWEENKLDSEVNWKRWRKILRASKRRVQSFGLKETTCLWPFMPFLYHIYVCMSVCWWSRATLSVLSEERNQLIPIQASRGHYSSTDWTEKGWLWEWKLWDRQLRFICSSVTTCHLFFVRKKCKKLRI